MLVSFCAQEIVVQIVPTHSMAVVSITNPGENAPLKNGWGAVLRVSFADAQYDESTIKSLGNLWSISSLGFINKAHALAIREFLDNLDPSIASLVVHCGAGVSRSAAVAMYAADQYGAALTGDLSKHNTTVLRLLKEPYVFDAILPKPKESWTTSFSKKATTWMPLRRKSSTAAESD